MNKLGSYVDVLRFALIRAEWYENNLLDESSRNIWLNESIQALESSLIMFKNARDKNQQQADLLKY